MGESWLIKVGEPLTGKNGKGTDARLREKQARKRSEGGE